MRQSLRTRLDIADGEAMKLRSERKSQVFRCRCAADSAGIAESIFAENFSLPRLQFPPGDSNMASRFALHASLRVLREENA
jgi:hypothetical protein